MQFYLDEIEAELEADEVPLDPEEIVTEVRFIPSAEEALELMYKAVQECTLLHPDPSSDLSGKIRG